MSWVIEGFFFPPILSRQEERSWQTIWGMKSYFESSLSAILSRSLRISPSCSISNIESMILVTSSSSSLLADSIILYMMFSLMYFIAPSSTLAHPSPPITYSYVREVLIRHEASFNPLGGRISLLAMILLNSLYWR